MWSIPGMGPAAGCCGHSDEPFVSIKSGEFLDQINNC